ncbi:hypothetical protein SSX86_003652 [Deinandra increscens subsp. villosa]|uniref:Neprosin PEP catalytic domain-containing protein n=1 Tax=Deinandra increscens subsp. villosa TaxID=3103831 RepID=A0AAP0H6Z3_9ASTR
MKIKRCFFIVVVLYAFMVLPIFAKRFGAPKHLNGLNKHPVKSIKSPDGDIIECIHILHQPAFNNPLLKDHSIKMSPSYHPNGINSIKNGSSSSPPFAQLWHSNGKCPKGTIPIRRRTQKDDVFVRNHRKKSPFDPELDDDNHEYAHAYTEEGPFYGTQATFSVWNPNVQLADEFSLGQLWITAANYETIEVGWQVYPGMYGDSTTRLFIFWTNDGYQNNQCYNLDCPGFIQTNNEIVLGGSISPTSEVDGYQNDMTVLVWKNPKDGNWWLEVGGKILGYWPSSLYTRLSESASMLDWGGEVVNDRIDGLHTTTQMGSGYFSEEGSGKASYIKNIQIVDEYNVFRSPGQLTTSVSRKDCYDLTMGNNDIYNWGTYLFFGGPGRNQYCVQG